MLAADDQQHILEAIELLLRPQGYVVDTPSLPLLVREALLTSTYDALLIDLNYTRDTTSGREGLDLLSEIVVARQQPSGDRHDGVGQRGIGSRSHAARCARLHPEALGQRAPAEHSAHAGRTASRLATRQNVSKPKTACFAPRAARNSSPLRHPCSQCSKR